MGTNDPASSFSSPSSSSVEEMLAAAATATSQRSSGRAVARRRTACDSCRARKIRCTHYTATAIASAPTMDPPSPTTKKQMKEKKKARKKSTSSPIDQSSRATSSESWSSVPSSYLSTFAASTTPDASVSTTSPSPAALLAQLPNGGEPGWRSSINAAWAQAQKNVYIRWVREKREKVARAEEALAAGRGSEEEVEEAMMELSEDIDDAIRRGCVMSELQ